MAFKPGDTVQIVSEDFGEGVRGIDLTIDSSAKYGGYDWQIDVPAGTPGMELGGLVAVFEREIRAAFPAPGEDA